MKQCSLAAHAGNSNSESFNSQYIYIPLSKNLSCFIKQYNRVYSQVQKIAVSILPLLVVERAGRDRLDTFASLCNF